MCIVAAMSQNMVAGEVTVTVAAETALPPGMTQQEADRLIAEADAQQKEND